MGLSLGGKTGTVPEKTGKKPRRNKQQNEFILLNCKSPYWIRPVGAFLFLAQ